jgi:DNA-binding Xre family transcriptional regulator
VEELTIPKTTMRALAEEAGISVSVLSTIVNGKQNAVYQQTFNKLYPVLLSYFDKGPE